MTIKLDVANILAFAETLGDKKDAFLELMTKGCVDACIELLEENKEDEDVSVE